MAFVFDYSPYETHGWSNKHQNVQILTRCDGWLLNIKKLVKLAVSPGKATLRFMTLENPSVTVIDL